MQNAKHEINLPLFWKVALALRVTDEVAIH